MLVIGLTGSIGMGKSTAAARFRERGIHVFDADAEVHRLYDGPLAAAIDGAFPGSVVGGRVDRTALSRQLIAAPWRLKELEAIVHPEVRAAERLFLHDEHTRGATAAVLEIPLLFETHAEANVDVTIVVTASADVQRTRVLERSGMTQAKLETMLARQLPDDEKRKRADFVVETSGSVENCASQIDRIITKITNRRGTAYERHWRD
jgi:dephospho-CoA kinase